MASKCFCPYFCNEICLQNFHVALGNSSNISSISPQNLYFLKSLVPSVGAYTFRTISLQQPLISQRCSAGLQVGGSRVRVPAGAGNFSLPHRVQTGSAAHPTSYPMGTRGSFPGGKAAGGEADHSPPSSVEVKKCGAITPLPNTPSWRGAQLGGAQGNLPYLPYLTATSFFYTRPR
jgi:hypothetical protein